MPDVTVAEALADGTDPLRAELSEPIYREVVRVLCSPHFYSERVHGDDFECLLEQLIEIGTALDATKKILFYGKEPAVKAPSYVSSFIYDRVHPDIVHGILGIITEAVELAERLCKMARDPDNADHKTNLIEEIGDLDWYATLLRSRLGVTSGTVRLVNARKLFRRYPEKVFAATRAAERDLAAEQEALRSA